MNNLPLTNMAVSLSGGGYRATTFHLGALSLLDAIELEAGNKLICDAVRREKGATLLENVRIISTISGGTLTGIMYAYQLSQKGDFKDCFYSLHDLLTDDKLVEQALHKLNTPANWKNGYKKRNLINSFAEVYNEQFYDGATFGDLYNDRDSHLIDVIFGASEFTAGRQYRFQESGTGRFGSSTLVLPKAVSERIRLADSAASSSCFPGGFEPMTMPTDYSNGPDSRLEEWWAKKKIDFEKEASTAIEQAEKAVAEATKASKQQADLAASITAVLEKAAKAKLAAAEAAEKARKEKRSSLRAATTAAETGASLKAVAEEKAKRAVKKAETATEASLKAAAAVSQVSDTLKAAAQAIAEQLAEDARKAEKSAVRATDIAAQSGESFKADAEAKANEAAKDAADAQKTSDELHKAAHEALNEAQEASAKAPQLASILSTALNASEDAALAIAAAEEAASDAEKRVKSSMAKAEEKAIIAEIDRELAAIALAAVDQSDDRMKALENAEEAAVIAEQSSKVAEQAAEAASDASADVALIAVEKVICATAMTEKKIKDVTKTVEKAPALEKALAEAKATADKAIVAVAAAKMADTVAEKAKVQSDYGASASKLAENASEEVANHCLTDGYAAKYVKGDKAYGKSYKNQYKKGAAKSKKVTPVSEETKKPNLNKKAILAVEALSSNTNATVEALEAASARPTEKSISIALSKANQATAAAVVAEKATALARNEKPIYPTTAIMDGGILDNQGIRGVVMAEKRHSSDGKRPPFIGTYIISDVSGKIMAPYEVPVFNHSSFWDFFTLKRLNIIATVLFLGIVGLLIISDSPTWGVIVASSILTILMLWFLIFLGIRSFFRAKIKETFSGADDGHAVHHNQTMEDNLPEIMKDLKILVNTPLYIVIYLMKFRASSALKMITDVFLRRIRDLQIHGLFKSSTWNYRLVTNNIYALKDADNLTADLKKVVSAANNMPTTLWFSKKEKEDGVLDHLIACGQLTLCKNLVDYIQELKKGSNKERVWDQIPELHEELEAVQLKLEAYWEKFRVDPHWLMKQYQEERAQHEAEKKALL